MKCCNAQCLTAYLLHINSGHFQGSYTLKYSLEFFCFIWVSKQKIPPNICLKQVRGWLDILGVSFKITHGIKPIQTFQGISPRDTSLMHYCTLHACCRLPFLEAWLQLDRLRGCIQHPGRIVLWKQVLLGLQQGTKIPFDCKEKYLRWLFKKEKNAKSEPNV